MTQEAPEAGSDLIFGDRNEIIVWADTLHPEELPEGLPLRKKIEDFKKMVDGPTQIPIDQLTFEAERLYAEINPKE